MHPLRPNIRARAFAFLFALGALSAITFALPVPARACSVIAVKSAALKPYQEALRGLKDGCNCDVSELDLANGTDGVAEAFRQSSDPIVTIGTSVFKKARAITGQPVIYTMVMPSETGPGLSPNISGVSMNIAPAAYLESMREVFPSVRKVGLLYDPKNTGAFVEEAAKAAAEAGMELVVKAVRSPTQAAASLESLRGKIDIFWMLPDPTVVSPETIDYLLQFSFQNNLPVFSFSRKYVEMGALASLDVDPYDMGVQAGRIVSRLFAGQTAAIREYARPSSIVINMKVARKMNIIIGDKLSVKVEKIE